MASSNRQETVALLGLKGLLLIVFNLNKDENVFVS